MTSLPGREPFAAMAGFAAASCPAAGCGYATGIARSGKEDASKKKNDLFIAAFTVRSRLAVMARRSGIREPTEKERGSKLPPKDVESPVTRPIAGAGTTSSAYQPHKSAATVLVMSSQTDSVTIPLVRCCFHVVVQLTFPS